MDRLFLPGWGARATAYRSGLPDGWTALAPPCFGESRGSLKPYTSWLASELHARRAPVLLAGHSMGAALAVLAAAAHPERVSSLVLIAPAGLPLVKPMAISAAQFLGQAALRRSPLRESLAAIGDVASAPLSAFRVARTVRSLDLSQEMRRVCAHNVPVTIIGCRSDTLVTSSHCRRAAELLAARYRELPLEGGHTWMFGSSALLAAELSRLG